MRDGTWRQHKHLSLQLLSSVSVSIAGTIETLIHLFLPFPRNCSSFSQTRRFWVGMRISCKGGGHVCIDVMDLVWVETRGLRAVIGWRKGFSHCSQSQDQRPASSFVQLRAGGRPCSMAARQASGTLWR